MEAWFFPVSPMMSPFTSELCFCQAFVGVGTAWKKVAVSCIIMCWGYHGIVINKTNSSGRLRRCGPATVSGRPTNSTLDLQGVVILPVSSGERRRCRRSVGSGVGAGVVGPLRLHALRIELQADIVRCAGVDGVGAVVRSRMMQHAVPTGHGAGSGVVVAEALSLVCPNQRCGMGVLHDPHERCPQATVQAGCVVMTQESMVLASVDRGCGAGRDGASCTSRAVSTGHGAGSVAGVSRSGIVGCGVSRRCQSAGPTGHGASSCSVKSSDDGVGETRVAVQSGAM
ncbi:hypothetical protein NDU88_004688 [Pleurodeles waltl]|uniref:Uncharacterized protein n=1 Tax=Pleurodeles waltl TaxID=8319 RepID=A0AAV7MU66_PLEWA|nr:hypothetical protein NDU88_004688 [Pleurodeles waltl]